MVQYRMVDGKVPSGEEMLEVYGTYDVVVVGGGMAGCGAGIAAARAGAKTLIIEATSALGGLATMGLVNIPLDYRCGIGDEMITELEKINGHWHRNSDPEKHKFVLDQMMKKYGCETLFVTQVVDAIVEGNDVKGLLIQTKRGRRAIFAKRFVDASGDSDLVYYAGGECECGRARDGYSMGTSLEFVMGGVDWDAYVASDIKLDRQWMNTIKQALAAGDLPYEIDNHLNWMTHLPGRPEHCGKDEVSICIAHSRRAIPTDNTDLTRMYIEGREQVPALVSFIKKYIPGFADAYLIYTGALLGVRESRRIVGEYRIRGEDLAYGRHFDDVVSISSHGYDFHGYLEAGNPKWIRMKLEDGREAYVSNVGGWGSQLPPDDDLPRINMSELIKDETYYYDIPYRAMLPIRLENVIAAGRNLSSNVAGQSGCRLVLLCCNLGEAAGTAAVKSIRDNVRLRDVNVPELQRELVANGLEIGQKYRKIPALEN